MFVQGWGPNFAIVLLGRLGFGISTLAREPARVLLMHRLFSPREFILVSGVYNLLFGLVVGGGLVLTPIILSRVGDDWRRVLLTFAVTLGVLAVLWTILGSDGEENGESERQEADSADGRLGIIKRVLRYKELWIAGTGSMGTTMAWSSFVNFYPTLMLDVYDVSLNWTGLLLAIGIACGWAVWDRSQLGRTEGERKQAQEHTPGDWSCYGGDIPGNDSHGLDPSTHPHNARQRYGAGILADPQLDTVLPTRYKASGVRGCVVLHDDARHVRGSHRPGAGRRTPGQARRPETRHDDRQLRADPCSLYARL